MRRSDYERQISDLQAQLAAKPGAAGKGETAALRTRVKDLEAEVATLKDALAAAATPPAAETTPAA